MVQRNLVAKSRTWNGWIGHAIDHMPSGVTGETRSIQYVSGFSAQGRAAASTRRACSTSRSPSARHFVTKSDAGILRMNGWVSRGNTIGSCAALAAAVHTAKSKTLRLLYGELEGAMIQQVTSSCNALCSSRPRRGRPSRSPERSEASPGTPLVE